MAIHHITINKRSNIHGVSTMLGQISAMISPHQNKKEEKKKLIPIYAQKEISR